ncbi:ABC transporter substrate-binding protein [Vallitalea guaymasensis]|uniref:ABC transporter substrate-binding protein n=1 Tax=Vallitalea guaymasensis TaxID=1185412 RepID=UPI002729779D|nr:ABC transporter substrate-binding protein [Vallitalea guaymasensis]
MRKRIFVLVLTVLMITSTMVGCGNKDKKETSNTENGNQQTAGENEPKEEKELEFVELSWYYPGSPQSEQDVVFAEINKLLKEKINTKVNFHPVDWGSYEEKMKVKIGASEEFDICFTANWMNNYQKNVSQEAFISLDDLLNEYGSNILKGIPEKFWGATKIKGEIYGIPNYQISTMTNGFWFKKDLIDKYNVDYKELNTLDKWEVYLKTIKENEPQIIPTAICAESGSNWGRMLVNYGFDEVGGRNIPGVVRLTDNSYKVINQFASDEFMSFVSKMHDWYEKGYIRDDALAIQDPKGDIEAGKIASGMGGNYKPGADAEMSATYGEEYVNVKASESYLLTSSIIATLNAISRTSKNPERAMMVLDLMNSDKEIYNMLCYGIEGTHYNKTGDNSIEIVEDSKYKPNTNWIFGNTFNAYLLPGQSQQTFDDTQAFNMNSEASPILGFVFNQEPVSMQIAQCTTVVDEFILSLDTGTVVPDEYLPKFLDKLEKAGSQKIIDEMQKQVDEWLKTK